MFFETCVGERVSDCWRRNWWPLRSVTAPTPRPRAHRTLRAEEEKGGEEEKEKGKK